MENNYGNGNYNRGNKRPFVRARQGRVLGGLCLSLANRLDLDVSLVRIVTVVLAFMTSGGVGLLYLLAWVIIPEEDWGPRPYNGPGGPGYGNGPQSNPSPGQGGDTGAAQDNQNQYYTPEPEILDKDGRPVNDGSTQERSRRGILFIGGSFAVVGCFLLLNRLFGGIFSWRYLWPVLLMLLGVYLIIHATNRTR